MPVTSVPRSAMTGPGVGPLRLGLAIEIGMCIHGLTKVDVSKRAGIDPAYLSRIVSSARQPSAELADWLLREVGISANGLAIINGENVGLGDSVVSGWVRGRRSHRRPQPRSGAPAA